MKQICPLGIRGQLHARTVKDSLPEYTDSNLFWLGRDEPNCWVCFKRNVGCLCILVLNLQLYKINVILERYSMIAFVNRVDYIWLHCDYIWLRGTGKWPALFTCTGYPILVFSKFFSILVFVSTIFEKLSYFWAFYNFC